MSAVHVQPACVVHVRRTTFGASERLRWRVVVAVHGDYHRIGEPCAGSGRAVRRLWSSRHVTIAGITVVVAWQSVEHLLLFEHLLLVGVGVGVVVVVVVVVVVAIQKILQVAFKFVVVAAVHVPCRCSRYLDVCELGLGRKSLEHRVEQLGVACGVI